MGRAMGLGEFAGAVVLAHPDDEVFATGAATIAGDSVLLRFVLDESGWDRDRFVPLT